MAVMLKEQGNEYFKNGDLEAALRCYSKATEHDKLNPHLHLNKAAVLLKMKKYRDTIECANEALRLTSGKNAKGWFRRGNALYELGDIENSLYDYEEALVLDPKDVNIKQNFQACEKNVSSIIQTIANEDCSHDQSYWYDRLKGTTSEQLLHTTDELRIWQQAPTNQKERIDEIVAVLWLLRINTVPKLNLLYQPIDLRVAFSIQTLLESTKHLVELNLSNTSIGPGGCRLLAKGLESNRTVLSISLCNCYIRRFGAEFLARALLKNVTLKSLDLHNASIRNEGLEALTKGLKENQSLTRIVLSKNGITLEGASKVMAFLLAPTTLKYIDLSLNLFQSELLFERAQEKGIELKQGGTDETTNDSKATNLY